MAVLTSGKHPFVTDLEAALGLPGETRHIELSIAADAVITARVEYCPSPEALNQVRSVLKQYQLVPVGGSVETPVRVVGEGH